MATGTEANEARFLFAREGGAVTVRLAILSDEGVEPRPLPALSTDDDDDLRWYLEDFLDLPVGGSLVRARRIEETLRAWGVRLFDALFGTSEHRAMLDRLLGGGAPRLLTIATNDLDVLRLPWELLGDERGPLAWRGVVIRRQLETVGHMVARATGTLPLRILVVVSRPDDLDFFDPRHTTRAMLDALAPLGDDVVVDFCRPATRSRLEAMLAAADRAGRPYHLLHFDGHGTLLPEARTGALCFEDVSAGLARSDEVLADELGDLLAEHRIPVVILEACRSSQIGRRGAFRGVAQALIEAGVGSVIAMSHAVHVEATRILIARFYGMLAGGASVGEALEAGREALRGQPARWRRRGHAEQAVALQDWFAPQLYQRGEDTMLAPAGAPRDEAPPAPRRAPAQGAEIGAFPPGPRCGFFGRAWELQRLERFFLRHRAIVLHAMGGMGENELGARGSVLVDAGDGAVPGWGLLRELRASRRGATRGAGTRGISRRGGIRAEERGGAGARGGAAVPHEAGPGSLGQLRECAPGLPGGRGRGALRAGGPGPDRGALPCMDRGRRGGAASRHLSPCRDGARRALPRGSRRAHPARCPGDARRGGPSSRGARRARGARRGLRGTGRSPAVDPDRRAAPQSDAPGGDRTGPPRALGRLHGRGRRRTEPIPGGVDRVLP